MDRNCERCGGKASPHIPRTRLDDGRLVCAGCAQAAARERKEPVVATRKTAHDSGDGATIFHCPFCLVGTTKYLTQDGMRTFAETVGTTQWVLTADRDQRTSGRWVQAHIHEFGEQPVLKITLSRNKRTKVIEATPEHRWLVKSNRTVRPQTPRISRKGKPRDWRPAECARGHALTDGNVRQKKNGTRECKTCATLAVPVGGTSRATDRDVLTRDLKPGMRLSHLVQPGVGHLGPADAGIRHGIVFGDGSAQGKSASVTLWGEKDKQLLRYFPNRKYTPDNTASRALGTGIPGVRVSGDLHSWMKAIPESTEDPAYLYGWLAGYFAADGTVSKQGQTIISSARLEHLEAVRDIALRLGISTYEITSKMRAGFPGREPSALYSMEFVGTTLNERFFLIEEHLNRFRFRNSSYERIGWTVVSIEETGRTEKVYCAVVPETHSFALEGNIWTGNCGSGQVIARSDRTTECEYCHTCFTVQVQPQFPAFPQTIDGMPMQVPGMPGQIGGPPAAPPGADGTMPPEDAGVGMDAGGFPPDEQGGDPENPDEAEDDDTDDAPPFAKGSALHYRTASGSILDFDNYIRHLAIKYTDPQERDTVLRRVREEQR